MIRSILWTLVLSMSFAALPSTALAAAPTPEEKCRAAKLNAVRKRDYCRAGEELKALAGKTPDLEKCAATFVKAIDGADKKAAKDATSCRWLEHGDGTATDLNSGLQWELKEGSFAHDVNGIFTWSSQYVYSNGTAFGTFLAQLNGGRSIDGITTGITTECLGGKCDWRLPTVEELRGLLSAQYPSCTTPGGPNPPCSTIPGAIRSSLLTPSAYWTASTYEGDRSMAWTVSFDDGFVRYEPKGALRLVRAVRGRS
ncbi:DUF1566 domain-containing protein [Candidatus Binatia bacterium]|nr:DUF1566 domain-containing protein [Candidatus Binatia bacterium]